jgi:hypothetical protein
MIYFLGLFKFFLALYLFIYSPRFLFLSYLILEYNVEFSHLLLRLIAVLNC